MKEQNQECEQITEQEREREQKEEYNPPELFRFGNIEQITLNASQHQMDGAGSKRKIATL
jgi:hypothetical protein